MAFLRNLLATILGLFIFCFLILLIFGGIAASSESIPSVDNNSVLHLNLSGVVVERAVDDPFREVFTGGPKPISLMDLLESIEAAKTDDRIQGIYLEPVFLSAGYSSLKEIRDALIDFKSSGKFLYAYGEYLSEGDYYLVSVADTIYLNPEGSLEFNGLSAGVTFFKGLFDKLDIEPEIFRVGEYKSFVEPFIRKSMSEENRLQLSELILSIHNTYLEDVSQSRQIPVSELKQISDQMMVRLPEDAVAKGLISKVSYEDEIIAMLKEQTGRDTDEDLKLIPFDKYKNAMIRGDQLSGDKIAVIIANGNIVMGEVEDAVGGDQFAREIREARENKSVKAIVLRINSPGGSLTASDIIWREIMLTRGEKPIIASMSDVAASGGYFIAMPCDTIVAQPNTITGSIGIFGLLFNFGDFLENKLGITTEKVNTGEFSDIMTVTRSLSDYERQIIQRQVEKGYETFVTKAAQGRNMSVEDLKEVAGGRVWTGIQAQEKGLVDIIGSFEDAVEIAASKAGIEDDYRLSFYPRKKPFVEKILTELSEAKIDIMNVNSPLTPYIDQVRSLEHQRGIQAKLPGNLEIR